MQYLNTMLWESFHDAAPLRNPYDTPMDPRINVVDENWQRVNAICWEYHSNQFADNHLIALGSHLAVSNLGKRNISKDMVIVYFDAYLN